MRYPGTPKTILPTSGKWFNQVQAVLEKYVSSYAHKHLLQILLVIINEKNMMPAEIIDAGG